MIPVLLFATIYVNPFATEEVIDKYITAATQVNTLLSENKSYRDFVKANKPFIEFECRGKEIARIDIKRKIDNEALKNEILTNAAPYRENIEKELIVFFTVIDMDDFLKKMQMEITIMFLIRRIILSKGIVYEEILYLHRTSRLIFQPSMVNCLLIMLFLFHRLFRMERILLA